jgi:hypothetical protein
MIVVTWRDDAAENGAFPQVKQWAKGDLNPNALPCFG